jgi:hypothetical protein
MPIKHNEFKTLNNYNKSIGYDNISENNYEYFIVRMLRLCNSFIPDAFRDYEADKK